MNKKTTSKNIGGLMTVEPNILGLFFIKDSNDRKPYIDKCVDSYQDTFSEPEIAFLKAFIMDIYDLFVSDNKGESNSPEEETAVFIDDLCKYSIDVFRFINEKYKLGDDYASFCNQLSESIDVCDLMADFLSKETSVLEKIHVEDFGSYSRESQKIILVLHGDYAKRINESLVELLKKNLRDIAKRIKSDSSEELLRESAGIVDDFCFDEDCDDNQKEVEQILDNYIKESQNRVTLQRKERVIPDIPIGIESKTISDNASEIDLPKTLEEFKKKEEDTFWCEIDEFLKQYTPKKIIAYLDKHIIAQEDAKMACAIHLYNHVKRCRFPEKIRKKNVLLLYGPSGSGKTEIYRVLKTISPVPIVIRDIGDVTSRGFAGPDLSEVISRIGGYSIIESDNIIGSGIRKRYSLLVLDEFDKIVSPHHTSHGENASTEIQSSLLYAMEDGIITDAKGKKLDVSSFGFVCVGAFMGLMDNLKKRSIGFNSEETILVGDITNALINYGMIPELASRIGTISCVRKIEVADLVRIMSTESMSPITQLKEEYAINGINLDVTDESIRAIAEMAYNYGLGARKMLGIIRGASERKYIEALEDGASKNIVVTEDDIFIKREM